MHKLTFEWDYTEVNYAGSHQALSSFLRYNAFGPGKMCTENILDTRTQFTDD